MGRRVLRLLDPVLQTIAADRAVTAVVRLWSSSVARRSPEGALRRLLALDELLQARIDVLAIDLDGGVHAKHRLTRYHDFFVNRVNDGETVLDIGCGKGELAHDLVVRAGVRVTGIDLNLGSLEFARSRFAVQGLEFLEGDAFTWQPPHNFDVVVLSNVLEHIASRTELLTRLRELTHPSRVLVRVPSRERDWLVPLRQELGLAHFSDPTHEIEYTTDDLRAELAAAGLRITELEQRWGEIWVVAQPTGTADA